jgi:beta-N-acetylhexosaminidase
MTMVGHASYPAFGDGPLPACLSPRIVGGLLRRKLGYRGVIVTSDLTMGAVTGIGLDPGRFLQAFEAGNDMLLFSQTTPLAEEGFRLLVRAARGSAALRSRLDRSVERILTLKERLAHPPLRYRPQMKARIARQILRLREAVEAPAAMSHSVKA